MSYSGGEALMLHQLKAVRLPLPEQQFRFHQTRRWKFDFCWPDRKLALEVEGGIYLKGGGRHNRPSSFEKDAVKYNEAALAGYRVLRVTTGQVKSGAALQWVERAIGETS